MTMWIGPLYFPDPEATLQFAIGVLATMGIATLIIRKDQQ